MTRRKAANAARTSAPASEAAQAPETAQASEVGADVAEPVEPEPPAPAVTVEAEVHSLKVDIVAAVAVGEIDAVREQLGDMALSVRSLSPDGHRRAGIAFGPIARLVPLAELDDDQLQALVSDRRLAFEAAPIDAPIDSGDEG